MRLITTVKRLIANDSYIQTTITIVIELFIKDCGSIYSCVIEMVIMVNTQWEKQAKDVLTTPKFLSRGTKVLIMPKTIPHPMEVEGRFGKRPVYIVESKEHGLIYVSPLQLVKIVEAFNGNYESAVTVEL